MKKLLIVVLLVFVFLVGCSKETTNNTPNKSENEVNQIEQPNESEPVIEEGITEEEISVELSSGEQLALDYVNNFVNTSDLEVKKKFSEENIHPEVKAIFDLGVGTETSEDEKYNNPTIVNSAKYESEGVIDGELILISADGDKEMIVMLNDSKIGWAFTPEAESTIDTYDTLKKQISK